MGVDAPPEPVTAAAAPAPKRRRYDSPLRRQRAVETRERLIAAGAAIVHSLPGWNWRGLTFRAVGERAGVSERTVHRHFATERELKEAVLQRLTEESGVKLDGLEVDNFAFAATRLFSYLSSFAAAPPALDPSFAAVDKVRREALQDAVARAAADWSPLDRTMAAGMLDMLWNLPSYERLIAAWGLDAEDAARAITWVIDLIRQAIADGHSPPAKSDSR